VHYQKGLEYLRADRKELAAAEFREAVRLVPDFSAARQALEVVEDLGGDIQSIPTLTPAPDVLATLFAEGKSFYAAGRWPEAARKLEELVGAAPNYRAAEVEAMLFDSHMQAGLAAVEADQWDEALRQFDQALAIRPNDSEALRQRGHAEIYREGAKAWGSEWDRAVLAFNRLHELAPGYHDVGSRLREARVQYGNVFYSKRIWCQAEDQYREAIQIEPGSASSDLQERATDAGHRCEAEKRRAAEPRSTPTPSPGDSAPPDATIPAGEFVFVAAGPVAPAFDLGCSGHYIFGEVRSAANELLAGVRIQAVDQWGNVYANASKGPPRARPIRHPHRRTGHDVSGHDHRRRRGPVECVGYGHRHRPVCGRRGSLLASSGLGAQVIRQSIQKAMRRLRSSRRCRPASRAIRSADWYSSCVIARPSLG